jgi:hypothetical protein
MRNADQSMPAVEQVKLQGDPVGAIPILMFCNVWIDTECAITGDVIDRRPLQINPP